VSKILGETAQKNLDFWVSPRSKTITTSPCTVLVPELFASLSQSVVAENVPSRIPSDTVRSGCYTRKIDKRGGGHNPYKQRRERENVGDFVKPGGESPFSGGNLSRVPRSKISRLLK